ncbi:MAG: PSD1 and planctomycete cytochrome C domain-containing protein [Fuerstiella sp.]
MADFHIHLVTALYSRLTGPSGPSVSIGSAGSACCDDGGSRGGHRGCRLLRRTTATMRLPLLIVVLLAGSARSEDISFERHVRPILKAHCFHCHGEGGEKEGGLDLRLRRLMVEGGDSGPAIVPEAADESLLLERIQSGDMPPGDDKRLPQKDIDLLTQWITSGARTARAEPTNIGDGPVFTEEERSYWAFQSPDRPPVPDVPDVADVADVADAGRVRTAIDAFILNRQNGFAADADRERLVRRAWFDLIGLPPSPADVDAALNDDRDDWWERLIDQLLASEHYGERWGRHWLDVAGYADSEGYTEEDKERKHAWRYRDYVIQSFNRDKPFDVFVQEQLAGDEMVPLPHRNLTPDAVEKLTATGFLRMAPDGTASGGIDKAAAQNQAIADTLEIVSTALLGLTVNCAQCHDHRYDPIPTADYYRLRAVFEPAFDTKNWRTPAGRQVSLYTDSDRAQAAAVEAEAVAVDQERQQKAEQYITRTLEEELLLVPADRRDALRTAYRTAGKERTAEQTALLKEYPSVASISVGSLYLYDRRRDERASKLEAERVQKAKQYTADASRTAGVPVTEANLAEFAPEAAAELQWLADQAKELRSSKAAVDLKAYADRAAEIRGRKPVEGFIRALAEVPGKIPTTFVFFRGDHEQPKDEVRPGDLSILDGTATFAANDETIPTTGRRLAFAKHLTSGRHPLLARVAVNRIWMHHFGKGLVESAGDFGVLGTRPTHPELLDWLAAEFVDSGWSTKHMHRLMMRSTVYRQASLAAATGEASEGSHTGYVGYPLRRLESEVIRDAVLAVSGLLNEKQFGEPVPVMEDAVGQIVIGKENLDGERKPTKPVSLNGEEFRRSIYIQVRRSRTLSVFETFDAATLSPNCSQRSFSTATPQSLLMMNSNFAIDHSEAFADRVMREGGDDPADRVTLAWRLAFGLKPSADDVTAATEFISGLAAEFEAADEKTQADQAAQNAMAVFCQALLSSSQFLYVE